MTATERAALTAAFLAAAVVAGLALSYVPHVELVTLVVFSSGILLGPGGGATVGGAGMILYVFANSALRGFPPSPLPLLAAQSAGMILPGLAGGIWRRIWLRGGTVRRAALWSLPLVGAGLSALYQALTNLVFALLMSGGSAGRLTVFGSGMAFGLLDMVSNGLVFAVAGPGTASLLRRAARDRGWWGTRAGIALGLALTATLAFSPEAIGSPEPPSAAADSLSGPKGPAVPPADTLAVPGEAAAPDSLAPAPQDTARAVPPSPPRAAAVSSGRLRRLQLHPAPLWSPLPEMTAARDGKPNFLAAGLLEGGEVSRNAAPAVPSSIDRWGLGWGRTRFTYDGLPFGGGVYRFEEPIDLPLAWPGIWSERFTASGTQVDLGAPPPPADAPSSQISLTTGSLGKRTAEFALFRNLGAWEVGADLGDRQEQGIYDVSTVDASRFWFHLRPAHGRVPDWTVDVGTGSEARQLVEGGELARQSRRLFATLNGPFWGGATRFGLALRREALQDRGTALGFGEVLFDGYTLQADWAGPFLSGVRTQIRWDVDRERDILGRDTFHGIRGTGAWTGKVGFARASVEGTVGKQDPFGTTWEGSAVARVGGEDRGGTIAIAREADLPAMVIGIDRPTPESGIFDRLDAYNGAAHPEKRTSIRLEGNWKGGPLTVRAGGWGAKERYYRVDANPVWVRFSEFSPLPYPPDRAQVLGAYARVRLDLLSRVFAEGSGRVHDRDLAQDPYTARWITGGAIHWRRPWFKNSLDLDASLGGTLIGPRRNPDGSEYPTTGLSSLRLVGRIDNGTVTVAFENLLDSYMESDLRASDTVTPIPIAGRTLVVGLTMYLSE